MASECPHQQARKRVEPKTWWPNQLDLKVLNRKGANDPDPSFDYAREFQTLNMSAVKRDLAKLMVDSNDWWPADYGHYGPFMIRMAWHSAGTYRSMDGRGGANTGSLRFAPLNSWPDNANLDKAKRLLWPIKKKYGRKISWADLMILAGNVAIESMGLPTFGFAGGRVDVYAPEDETYWGPEQEWLADDRHSKSQLDEPLGAVQMGLIYVNPQGPGGNPDPIESAKDIRETFKRMAMNDEETVALIAGGHTFGKAHGAADPDKYVGPEPEGAAMQEQGLGWMSSYKTGKGVNTITSGLEGAWTTNPIAWDNEYFDNLFGYDWTQVKSPGGATQWIPTDSSAQAIVSDAHDSSNKHAPIMFTTDLALLADPVYGPISKRFHERPEEFAMAFTKAWYKLTHRDMGPITRCLGHDVPEAQLWQDPIPDARYVLVTKSDIQELKQKILQSGLTVSLLVRTAWASASTYRVTDHRGGANGGRIRLAPQKNWEVNDPDDLTKVLRALEAIQTEFNKARARHDDNKQVSIADLIVLGGCAAVELAAENGGHIIEVPFFPGRTDASQEQTDVGSFAVLEPIADGFRNHSSLGSSSTTKRAKVERTDEELLVDRAQLLTLTAPEMTVLVGGMRVLNANSGKSPQIGVLTTRPEVLSNDFFVTLLDMGTTWQQQKLTAINNNKAGELFEARCCDSGKVLWTGSRVDLVFGSNSELRTIAEFYACDDSKTTFVQDFVVAWCKVMNLDRFDLAVKQYDGSSYLRSKL